jgi:hypothetical protein
MVSPEFVQLNYLRASPIPSVAPAAARLTTLRLTARPPAAVSSPPAQRGGPCADLARPPEPGGPKANSLTPCAIEDREDDVTRTQAESKITAITALRPPLEDIRPPDDQRQSQRGRRSGSRLTGRRISHRRDGEKTRWTDRRLQSRDGPRERPQHAARERRRPDAPTAWRRRGATAACVGASPGVTCGP